MLRQLTDLNFKMITSILAARYVCAWTLTSVLNPPVEEHCGPSQASQMRLFERIVDVFKLTLLFFREVPGMLAGSDNTYLF